jgi:hypothetical protein
VKWGRFVHEPASGTLAARIDAFERETILAAENIFGSSGISCHYPRCNPVDRHVLHAAVPLDLCGSRVAIAAH